MWQLLIVTFAGSSTLTNLKQRYKLTCRGYLLTVAINTSICEHSLIRAVYDLEVFDNLFIV